MEASNLPTPESRASNGAPQHERLEPLDSMPLRRGRCDWCGGKCKRGRTYCGPSCRVAYNNLLTRQGKVLVQALKVWRMYRGRKESRGAGKLTVVSARVDAMLAEDRERWGGDE